VFHPPQPHRIAHDDDRTHEEEAPKDEPGLPDDVLIHESLALK
jgi:hypothetical protein